jgi:hypothetical protein
VVDDDDDLDEGVVLAAHATQLLPESSEVIGRSLVGALVTS